MSWCGATFVAFILQDFLVLQWSQSPWSVSYTLCHKRHTKHLQLWSLNNHLQLFVPAVPVAALPEADFISGERWESETRTKDRLFWFVYDLKVIIRSLCLFYFSSCQMRYLGFYPHLWRTTGPCFGPKLRLMSRAALCPKWSARREVRVTITLQVKRLKSSV